MEVRAFRMFHLAEVDCRLSEFLDKKHLLLCTTTNTLSLYRLDNNYAILSRKTANKKKHQKSDNTTIRSTIKKTTSRIIQTITYFPFTQILRTRFNVDTFFSPIKIFCYNISFYELCNVKSDKNQICVFVFFIRVKLTSYQSIYLNSIKIALL